MGDENGHCPERHEPAGSPPHLIAEPYLSRALQRALPGDHQISQDGLSLAPRPSSPSSAELARDPPPSAKATRSTAVKKPKKNPFHRFSLPCPPPAGKRHVSRVRKCAGQVRAWEARGHRPHPARGRTSPLITCAHLSLLAVPDSLCPTPTPPPAARCPRTLLSILLPCHIVPGTHSPPRLLLLCNEELASVGTRVASVHWGGRGEEGSGRGEG